MIIEFGLLILGAYLLGAVPAAYLVAMWSRGIDLKQYGSGNIGTSNLWNSASRWLAPLVGIFDFGKGMVAVWVAYLLGLGIAQQVIVGLAAIIGHNWSIFLRFSGGRGVLSTLGLALFLPLINNLMPWGIIVFCVITIISLLVTHSTPLGVGAGIVALPLVSWGFSEPVPLILGYLAMFLLVVLKRLTAPRTPVAASVSPGQLLLNRLLFDRDIRDREAWMHRAPLKNGSTEKSLKRGEKQGKDR